MALRSPSTAESPVAPRVEPSLAERSPIILIGTGRSGTTLLRVMLSAHPRIYITHELSFYVWEKLLPRGASGRELLEALFETFSFRWLRVDPARVRAALPDPLPRERLGEAFTAIMREKAAQYGRVRWGDKTPGHTYYLKRVFEDFPEARVVHIVRDPRDTALSLRRMPWASKSLYANAVACELDWKRARAYRDRILQVRLEDLIGKPRETMGRVLDHVGEPWDDAVLDHSNHVIADDMPPFPWFEKATQGPSAKLSGVVIPPTPLETRMMERLARGMMKEAGYKPAALERAPNRLAVWRAGLREIPECLRYLLIYRQYARQLAREGDFTGEAMALFRRINPEAWRHYPAFEMPTAPTMGIRP